MSYNKETGMYEGYIYIITNTKSHHKYVGQTLQTIEKRWHQHELDSKKYDYPLYRAIKKYGSNNFNVYEIEKCVSKNKIQLSRILDEKEIYWISYYDTYNNGYNQTIGGQNNAPNKFPERPVAEYTMQGVLINTYPSLSASSEATGFSRSDISSCCLKRKVNRVQNRIFRYLDDPLTQEEIDWYILRYPQIYQYDFYGKLINVFDFVQDAVNYFASNGITIINGNISKCCNGEALSAGGYVWRKYPDKFGTYKTPRLTKKIEKRDKNNGDLLETFNNFGEIYEKYQYDLSDINNCCNNHHACSYGYHWCYEGEFNVNNLKRIRFKSITQYSISGEYIKDFNSAYEAVEELNLTSLSASAQILAVCNGKRNTAYGYVWRYTDDDFSKYNVNSIHMKCNINKYIDGKYIDTFTSAKEAAKSVGNTNSAFIRECCRHLRKSYKGAEWYYDTDITQPDKTKIIA